MFYDIFHLSLFRKSPTLSPVSKKSICVGDLEKSILTRPGLPIFWIIFWSSPWAFTRTILSYDNVNLSFSILSEPFIGTFNSLPFSFFEVHFQFPSNFFHSALSSARQTEGISNKTATMPARIDCMGLSFLRRGEGVRNCSQTRNKLQRITHSNIPELEKRCHLGLKNRTSGIGTWTESLLSRISHRKISLRAAQNEPSSEQYTLQYQPHD